MWSDMLELGSKPDAQQAEHLRANFEKNCQKAADALADADIFLLVTGAGFSADSGLAVYGDVAKVPAYQARGLDYSDICMADWLLDDPELFYGFWGQCFNDYRATQPHEGYDILARWRNDKNSNAAVAEDIQARIARKVQLRRPFDDQIVQRYTPYLVQDGPAGAFFSFTSNVDAHFHDIFEAHEIHECHGNIETWQCSDPYCSAGIWRAPLDYTFEVDKETMLAPATKSNAAERSLKTSQSENKVPDGDQNHDNVPHIGCTGGKKRLYPLKKMPPPKDPDAWHTEKINGEGTDYKVVSNWPQCGHCQSFARPAILMFGDFGWKRDASQSERWDLWKEAVLDACEERGKSNPLKMCIVEVGCGLNVPTCRGASERTIADVQRKGGHVTLVRVNPDFPLAPDDNVNSCLIPIMSRGLHAIKRIDKLYRGP